MDSPSPSQSLPTLPSAPTSPPYRQWLCFYLQPGRSEGAPSCSWAPDIHFWPSVCGNFLPCVTVNAHRDAAPCLKLRNCTARGGRSLLPSGTVLKVRTLTLHPLVSVPVPPPSPHLITHCSFIFIFEHIEEIMTPFPGSCQSFPITTLALYFFWCLFCFFMLEAKSKSCSSLLKSAASDSALQEWTHNSSGNIHTHR